VNAGTHGCPGSAYKGWWAYWSGYWLLERRKVEEEGKTTVLPGRALWVWGLPGRVLAELQSEEWSAEEQVVQDAVASERGEFSVVAERSGVGGGYAAAGQVEELGEAASYGAPETMRGGYTEEGGTFELNMAWDSELVLQFGATGSPGSLRGMIESVKAALSGQLAKSAGE
jgi:hypothetical protein